GSCRVGPGNFAPSLSQIPDVILSHHPARAIARRLPPSAEIAGSSRFDPVGPRSTTMTPPSLHGHCPTSSLLRVSPPLSCASVLSECDLERWNALLSRNNPMETPTATWAAGLQAMCAGPRCGA